MGLRSSVCIDEKHSDLGVSLGSNVNRSGGHPSLRPEHEVRTEGVLCDFFLCSTLLLKIGQGTSNLETQQG